MLLLKLLNTDQSWNKTGMGALIKIAPSGGSRENCWGNSCEKSRFYQTIVHIYIYLVIFWVIFVHYTLKLSSCGTLHTQTFESSPVFGRRIFVFACLTMRYHF
jgi:hypothetical protein